MKLARKKARLKKNWDYFLVLNNDIEAKHNLVDELLNQIKKNPKTGVIGAYTETPEGISKGLYYQCLTGLLFKNIIPGGFFYLPGHCLLVRNEAIREELFSPKYFMYGEDIEFNWNIKKSGWNIDIVKKSLLKHLSSKSSDSRSFFYEYHVNRGHILLASSLSNSNSQQAIMYTARALFLVLKGIKRSFKNKNLAPIKASFLCWFDNPIRPRLNGKTSDKSAKCLP